MYIGRFVILGKTASDAWYLGYRVSSRSFPNRRIVVRQDRAMVLPTGDAPPTDNPYIAYNCLRVHEGTVVVANGSHVDPIIDKVAIGYPLRDAMALSLLALDYEHDSYNTPRIAAGVDTSGDGGFLGIVSDGSISVRRVTVAPGEARLVATYELTVPAPIALEGDDAASVCDAILRCEYEHPVAALAVVLGDGGALDIAARTSAS